MSLHVSQVRQKMKSKIKRMRTDHAAYKMVDTCAAEFAAETPYYYAVYGGEMKRW